MSISKEELDKMIEEVASYEVTLAEDPTDPTFGLRYLQQSIAKCRNYSNRVTFYIQRVSLAEKSLKRDLKESELDLEFKMAEKLADDELVRKQPSIEDRKALASTFLKEEHQKLAEQRVILVDLEQTKSILRMKHQDLQRTANDIKLQRQMIKDDKDDQLGGGDGYVKPQTNQDRTVPNGLAPPVAPPPNPTDLLDPNKRPDGLPEPKDNAHARMMAEFLSRNPERVSTPHSPLAPDLELATSKDLLEASPASASAPVLPPPAAATAPVPEAPKVSIGLNYEDLLS